MRVSRTVARLALVVSLVGASSCELALACTEIGCNDQISVQITANVAAIPEGTHIFAITANGATSSCTFVFSRAAIADGQVVSASCPAGVAVQIRQAQVCTMTTTTTNAGVMASWTCEPIPDTVVEGFTLAGTPAAVRVQQSVGGITILDKTASPTYRVSQPNGPRCEPTCHMANVEWTIP